MPHPYKICWNFCFTSQLITRDAIQVDVPAVNENTVVMVSLIQRSQLIQRGWRYTYCSPDTVPVSVDLAGPLTNFSTNRFNKVILVILLKSSFYINSCGWIFHKKRILARSGIMFTAWLLIAWLLIVVFQNFKIQI